MKNDKELQSGLYIVALPIGNSRDITVRAIETLSNVDEIYCEDTRVTMKILNIYKIKKAINWKAKKKVFYIIKDYLNLV